MPDPAEYSSCKIINIGSFSVNSTQSHSIFSNSCDLNKLPSERFLSYNRQFKPIKKVYVQSRLRLGDKSAPLVCLLDCGADCCVIRYDVLRNLFPDDKLLKNRIRKCNVTVSGFNGSKATVMGVITFHLSFLEKSEFREQPVHFYVIKMEKKTTLGIIGITCFPYLNIQLSFYRAEGQDFPMVTRKFRDKSEIVPTHY